MRELDMRTFFEASEKEKQIAAVGREMMDYSENYGKIHGLKMVTDNGLRTLNELSYLGGKMTHFRFLPPLLLEGQIGQTPISSPWDLEMQMVGPDLGHVIV